MLELLAGSLPLLACLQTGHLLALSVRGADELPGCPGRMRSCWARLHTSLSMYGCMRASRIAVQSHGCWSMLWLVTAAFARLMRWEETARS